MTQQYEKGSWDSAAFFESLTRHNILAQSYGFTFCRISGLQGLEDALQRDALNLVCISDVSEGYVELDVSPHNRSVKTVFMAMRHEVEDMDGRMRCMEVMREIFRQFMSVLIREKIKLEEAHIFIDPRINFNEIEQYFFTGAACCFFNIAVDVVTDLRLNRAEWSADVSAFSPQFSPSFLCHSPAIRDI